MVHLRLHDKEPNPNPHINFITALPMPDAQDSEGARQLLRALAAQVRPVMKAHGFTVNSFEEYEYNTVFAGRNWNNGEVLEIVLRRANGSYCPTSWLMSTLCHELAHIKHMNHGPAFQALWARLRREVRQLQSRGYYGDGYWSSGTRLADSVHISGDGIEAGDFPEYMCGGAQTRTRPNARRRRRRPEDITPSLHTGKQTAKRRKAGGRVTSKSAFVGTGNSLTNDAPSSKGKRALSNRAREERALAAEKRLKALAQTKDTPSSDRHLFYEDSDSDGEIEFIQETDAERRRTLLDSKKNDSGENDCSLGKGLLWNDFENEFDFSAKPPEGSRAPPKDSDIIELTDDSDADIVSLSTSGAYDLKSKGKKGYHSTTLSSSSEKKSTSGNIVWDEVDFRKKEVLGLAPVKDTYRKLGQTPKANRSQQDIKPPQISARENAKTGCSSSNIWCCLVCTLENQAEHLACAACGTSKGKDTYHIR